MAPRELWQPLRYNIRRNITMMFMSIGEKDFGSETQKIYQDMQLAIIPSDYLIKLLKRF